MIEKLRNREFIIKERTNTNKLSSTFLQRYNNLPTDYLEFLNEFQLITNKDDSAWFNSIEDFNGESDSEFNWNEFEIMSLEALDDDEETCEEIRSFWNIHIPIAIAVEEEYQYLCIDLSSENYGQIYYGSEPEFEDSVDFICDTFTQLLELLSSNDEDYRLLPFK